MACGDGETLGEDILQSNVRGNCDSEVDISVSNFPIVNELSVISTINEDLYLTHGHIYNEAFHPNLNEGDILIHGHFHIPWLFDVDGVTIASPGSIAIPKNESPNSYMIIDNDKIDIKNLEGESILNSIRREYNQKY